MANAAQTESRTKSQQARIINRETNDIALVVEQSKGGEITQDVIPIAHLRDSMKIIKVVFPKKQGAN